MLGFFHDFVPVTSFEIHGISARQKKIPHRYRTSKLFSDLKQFPLLLNQMLTLTKNPALSYDECFIKNFTNDQRILKNQNTITEIFDKLTTHKSVWLLAIH